MKELTDDDKGIDVKRMAEEVEAEVEAKDDGDRHTVVTRSTSTYRTELSLCQQITSFPSIIAVSEDMLFNRC